MMSVGRRSITSSNVPSHAAETSAKHEQDICTQGFPLAEILEGNKYSSQSKWNTTQQSLQTDKTGYKTWRAGTTFAATHSERMHTKIPTYNPGMWILATTTKKC